MFSLLLLGVWKQANAPGTIPHSNSKTEVLRRELRDQKQEEPFQFQAPKVR